MIIQNKRQVADIAYDYRAKTDELTAKTDAEIFSDTQIDTGEIRKVAETTRTAQFGKNMVQRTKTTEMEISA